MLPEYGSRDADGCLILPEPLRLASDLVESTGVYLLCNGFESTVWLGSQASAVFGRELLGVDTLAGWNTGSGGATLPLLRTELSARVHAIVGELSTLQADVHVVKEGDRSQFFRFFRALIEDSSKTEPSYVDFLVDLHRAQTV